jgi:hypothetical protein
MAIDRSYQTFPEPCQLLEQAKFDHELGEYLTLTSFFLQHPQESRSPGNSPTWENFRKMVQELRGKHPGIEKRYYDVQRRQDSLLYLLSDGDPKNLAHDAYLPLSSVVLNKVKTIFYGCEKMASASERIFVVYHAPGVEYRFSCVSGASLPLLVEDFHFPQRLFLRSLLPLYTSARAYSFQSPDRRQSGSGAFHSSAPGEPLPV